MCIVGGDTYESVYSSLTLEEAIGLVTFDLHGHGLDTGLFAILPVGDGGLIALLVAVAGIHAGKHRGPVLALCTACSGIDLEDSSEGIFFGTEHVLQLHLFEESDGTGISFIDLLFAGDPLPEVL